MSANTQRAVDGRNPRTSARARSLSTISMLRREAKALLARKRWRKPVKRCAFVGVVLITNFSLLVTQTQAYLEYDLQRNTPAKVTLSAGPIAHMTDAISTLWRAIGDLALGFLPRGGGPPSNLTLSPAGSPYPWQAPAPAAPYSIANMTNGNLFTAVPIVGWQSLGLPIAFSLYHNTLGTEVGLRTLGLKWTHSYCRYLVYDSLKDIYTLFTDQGGSIPFSRQTGGGGHSIAYSAPTGIYLTLTPMPLAGKLKLTYKNQDVDEFDFLDPTHGRLLRALDASGNITTFTYETDPVFGGKRLTVITDPVGNELVLSYSDVAGPTRGHLILVTPPPIGIAPNELQRSYEIAYPTATPPEFKLDVGRARKCDPSAPDSPRLFWAEFVTNGAQLVTIRDYALNMLCTEPPMTCQVDEHSRTLTNLSYNAQTGRIATVTLAANFPDLQQTLTFAFDVNLPLQWSTVTADIRHATTKYTFDSYARLAAIRDPLNRDVVRITWDSVNNPAAITNVLGGVTSQTFDARGNVLSVHPPVGGSWTYTYDSRNNLTSITDPLNNATTFTYHPTINPTLPTSINGPGGSDITLEWGQGVDAQGNPASNLGKLTRTLSPNAIEQTFRYWSMPSDQSPPIHGLGQLLQRTFGRGSYPEAKDAGNPCDFHSPISDGVWQPDSTGNVQTWSVAGYPPGGHSGPGGGPGNYPAIAACNNGNPQTVNEVGDTCNSRQDADGNSSGCVDCYAKHGGDSSGPYLARFNGKDQPLALPQIQVCDFAECNDHHAGYTFKYDAFGRKIAEDACADEAMFAPEIQVGMFVYLAHTVTWAYDDANGTVARTYQRTDLDRTQENTISTVIATDLAGRVTSVAQQHGSDLAGAQYTYTDSTELPAITERRADGTSSEYYVDAAGQVRRIVHKSARHTEVLAFDYTRDDKGRVTRIAEYVEGGPTPNVTEYTYGDGHLSAGELDGNSSQVDRTKLYYAWLPDLSPNSLLSGDPNRLVKEVRTGDNGYHREYGYDVGGNRLYMREKVDHGLPGTPDWRTSRVVRYNYAYLPNYMPDDPRIARNQSLDLGEPDPGAQGIGDPLTSLNSYGSTEDPQGQDKLQGYTEYFFDDNGVPIADQPPVYTVYEYMTNGGSMSCRSAFDGRTGTQVKTVFTYDRSRLQSSVVEQITWPPLDPPNDPTYPDPNVDRERFVEYYAYNLFGERIGVDHCTALTSGPYAGPDGSNCGPCLRCSKRVRIFDYVDGQVLAERESDNHNGPHERFVSIYTWGLRGLIARRGVSMRNGYWDPNAPAALPEENADPNGDHECINCKLSTGPCNPGDPEGPQNGGFVSSDPDVMQDFSYFSDHMGNIVALVDSNPTSPTYGEARRQVFDAFGVNVGGYITFRCALDCDYQDNPGHLFCGSWFSELCRCPSQDNDPDSLCQPTDWPAPPCPNNPAQPVKRMQTGSFNWRGSEGSQTTLATEDMVDSKTKEILSSAYTQPGTGLVYMQARYYEPATGRFTQHDPVPYGPEMLWGQNNRWVYCANDPVNSTDASGMGPGIRGAATAIAIATASSIGIGLGAMYMCSWLGVRTPNQIALLVATALNDAILSYTVSAAYFTAGTVLAPGGGCYKSIWDTSQSLLETGGWSGYFMAVAFTAGFYVGMISCLEAMITNGLF